METRTRIYFASDHAGFLLKQALINYVSALGFATDDLGPFAVDPEDDYPDFVARLASAVASEPGSSGIVVGGSGQGEAMAANRVSGIRAAMFYGPQCAILPLEENGSMDTDGFSIVRLARAHNDANVLSLGARFVSHEDAQEATHLFLTTPFSGSERHQRRIAKF